MWQSHKQLAVRVSGELATGGQFLLFLVILLYPAGDVVALLFASLSAASGWVLDMAGLFIVLLVNSLLANNHYFVIQVG